VANTKITTNVIADGAITSAKLDTNITISGSITGTLATAAQPNITSLGTLTALTGGTGDLNWDSGTLFVDSSANAVGIGTDNPSQPLTISKAGDLYIQVNNSSAGFNTYLGTYTNESRIVCDGAKPIAFFVNGSRVVDFANGGNVGINTSSPTSYANSQATLVIQDTGSPAIAWSDTGQSKDWFAVAQGSGLYFNYADGGGSGGASNVTDVLVLDNSGNVGIGVSSPSEKLEVNGNIFVNTSGNPVITNKTSGAGNNPVFRLQADTNKWDIQGTFSNANDHLFFMYNSSTKMAITSGGLVGIGQTSPNVPLEIQSATPAVMLTDSDTGNSGVIEQDGTDLYYGNSSSSGTHIFKNNSSNRGRPSVNGNELMRIDSSGRVGIAQDAPADFNAAADDLVIGNSGGDFGMTIRTGTSSNGSIHFADGTTGDKPNRGNITYDHSDDHMQFNVAGAERMRIIEANGSILLGKSANSIDARGHWFRNNGESFHTVLNTDNTLHVYDTTNNLYRFYVTGGGTINATSTSITAISDERLKENIVDLETGLSEVMSLQPRRFDWKNGDGENVAGFIAQEVETVLPDLIGDYKHEELEDAKAIKMGDMIPTLVKAIQEQQTIIDDLKTRIEALEE